MNSERFYQVFADVLQPDRVKEATKTLKRYYYPHSESLSLLIQLILSKEASSSLRRLAATQARALVSRHWISLSAEEKEPLRRRLLQETIFEEVLLLNHSFAQVITAIAKRDLADGEWPGLFPTLLRAALLEGNPAPRQGSTFILISIIEAFGRELIHMFGDLLELFSKTISDRASMEVRINSMLALSKMAMAIDHEKDDVDLRSLQATIPQMVLVLREAVETQQGKHTDQCFEVFQILLNSDSAVVNRHLGDLIQLMLNVATAKNFSDEARAQAMNWLLQCLGLRKLKIQGLRLGQQMTLSSLQIATELKYNAWDDEDETVPRAALCLIESLASSLPPTQVVVPLLSELGQYVNSLDPEKRRAGIIALSKCVAGAPDFIATELHEILPLVLRLLEDPETTVRRAALSGALSLASHLPEVLEEEHDQLIPALVKSLDVALSSLEGPDDDANIDITCASCDAIQSLVNGLTSDVVKQYLPELVLRLSQLFSHQSLEIKVAAIGALGSAAESAEEGFLPFFQPLVDSLSRFVHLKGSPDELELRAAAYHAMGSMALAVGPQPFQRYVQPLMEATEESLHLDHPRLKETSYYLWGTMARVYGRDFKPFLEGVLTALFANLKAAESEHEIHLGETAVGLPGQKITLGGPGMMNGGPQVIIGGPEMMNGGPQVITGGPELIIGSQINEVVPVADDDLGDFDEMDAFPELEERYEDEEDSWDESPPVTAVTVEKQLALVVIGDILAHTTREYLPYVEKTIENVLPMTKHFYDGVRRAAVVTLLRIYALVWNHRGEQATTWEPGLPLEVQPSDEVMRVGAIAMEAMLGIWQLEENRETITDINCHFAGIVRKYGPALIANPTTLKRITEILIAIITKRHSCQLDYGNTDDIEDFDESAEHDWVVIDTALDTVVALAISLGETFGELWKTFEKPIMKISSSSEAMERRTSVGVIAECIEGMKGSVTPFTTSLLRLLLHRLSDEDLETKSNAAFAIGLLAEFSTDDQETLASYGSILDKLEPLLHMDGARIKDNAIGCVSRMIMKHQDHVPLANVLPTLVELLPLEEGFEENEPLYRMILHLYSKREPTMVGLTEKFIPVLAQVLGSPEEQVKESTREELVYLVRWVHEQEPALVENHESLKAAVTDSD